MKNFIVSVVLSLLILIAGDRLVMQMAPSDPSLGAFYKGAVAALARSSGALEQIERELASAEGTVKEWRRQTAERTSENEVLRQELITAKCEISSLENELEELSEEKTQAEAKFKTALDRAESNAEDLRVEIVSINSGRSLLEEKLVLAKSQTDSVRQELGELSKEFAMFKSDSEFKEDSLKELIVSSDAISRNLQNELTDNLSEKEVLESELNSAKTKAENPALVIKDWVIKTVFKK